MKINIAGKIFLPIAILLMIGFIALDQLAKKSALLLFSPDPIRVNDYLSLEIYKNSGIAFGLPVSSGVFYLIVILFVFLTVSGKFLNFKEMGRREIFAVFFILAGAAGNMIDRIRLGYIVDFINIKDITVFNLADVFIVIGAIALLEKIFPDTGRGKFKKNVYIFLFVIFGALIGFLIHAGIEIWYINLLLADFSKYGLGLSWPQWYIIHGVGTVILFAGGSLFGYLQGKHWWRVL